MSAHRCEVCWNCQHDKGCASPSCLAEIRELRARVRLARAEALGQNVSRSLWALLDLRRPLPKRKGARR